MKHILALFILILAAACGNPHLEKFDGIGSKNVPVIAEPDVLSALGLKADNGLTFRTELPSISQTTELLNLDADKEWNLELIFEKGTNFRFKGSQFPGEKGTCRADLNPNESCALEIEFFTESAGYYADNLKIKYTAVEDPTDIRQIVIPLRGERISTVVIVDNGSSLLSVRTSNSDKLLDFGKSFVNETLKNELIVKNIGSLDVTFDLKLSLGKEIKVTGGSCETQLKPSEECTVEVTFQASDIGLYQDNAVFKYSEKEIVFPILGEKIQKKKQGPLVASEVFSNNIDFGKVKKGITVTKQIEIQNLGESVYNLKDITLNNKVFNFKSACGPIIYPGTCLIDVTYSPEEIRKDSGLLKLSTIEGDAVELNLTGEGIEAQLCDTWNEYIVVPEKSYPASQVIFPYLRSHPSTTSKLSYLYGLEVNGYVKAIDNYAVADGMVYITFKLPQMKGTITNMNFGVKVLKVIRDNFKDTESLCLSTKGMRKCSGHEFSLASWQKLKNPKFWDVFNKPVSERYERQFAGGEHACGPYRCMNLNTQYELSDIFEMSEKEMQKIREEGTITLIFSDDTRMLKMPRIAIKTKTTRSCE